MTTEDILVGVEIDEEVEIHLSTNESFGDALEKLAVVKVEYDLGRQDAEFFLSYYVKFAKQAKLGRQSLHTVERTD